MSAAESLTEELGEPVSMDQLVGDWQLFQLRRGHRFSTDDLLVAGIAILARPGARRLLDIGAGVGSVGLMTLFAMPSQAHLTMVEVQEISHRLARASIHYNGLQDRIRAIHSDLRQVALPGEEAGFELITGSPPYIPLGRGVVSPHPQRAGARMELRGDVFDYCRTAERFLHPDGAFCFCHAAADPRPEAAIRAAGLVLQCRQDVIFREGQLPTIALFSCGRGGERCDLPPLHIRGRDGEWTEAYIALRRRMTTRGA